MVDPLKYATYLHLHKVLAVGFSCPFVVGGYGSLVVWEGGGVTGELNQLPSGITSRKAHDGQVKA